MSLIVSMVQYIDAQTSLTADTDLFVGGEAYDAPDKSVIVRELGPSSMQNYSGMQGRAVQVLVKELSYVAAETLAETVFNLFAHKTGFAALDIDENIYYVDVLSRPGIVTVDDRKAYIFSFNLLLWRS